MSDHPEIVIVITQGAVAHTTIPDNFVEPCNSLIIGAADIVKTVNDSLGGDPRLEQVTKLLEDFFH